MVPVIIKPSLRGEERRIVSSVLPQGRIALVTDTNTFTALGERILRDFPRGEILHIHDDSRPHADIVTANSLAEEMKECVGAVAVGSGTINDLCKYAAHQRGIPYLVFPTAPSMNGYVSATASLAETTLKTSHPATPPALAACDLEVLAATPIRLLRAGLGDSLARSTAQVDWLFSHLLLGTAYDERPYQMLVPHEAYVFAHADKLTTGNIEYTEQLIRLLLSAGEGMALANSSAPFSQGEHLFAHALEMLFPEKLKEFHHGEQIAVTSLSAAKLQARFLAGDAIPQWQPHVPEAVKPTEGYHEKRHLIGDYAPFQKKLAAEWPRIREKLLPHFLSPETLQSICAAAGIRTDPQSLGLTISDYENTARIAPYLRDRFTFLDVS